MTTATAKPLATIDGVMLTPGVSRNNRLYTREAIGRAVTRMRERLADPAGLPIVMRTHHAAGDNSRLIVGRITDVTQLPDGQAHYKAALYNTTAGRDIGALIDPKAPALRSTSIHGYWVGPVERHRQGADMVESGEDLEIDAIDFTATPGVPGAQVKTVAFESVVSRKEGHDVIEESAQATITPDPEAVAELDEVVDKPNPILEKYTAAQRRAMATKGQAMPDGTHPIATKSDLRAHLRAVDPTTPLPVREHIAARAVALGFPAMVPGGFLAEQAPSTTVPPPGPPVVEEIYVVVCVGDDAGPIVKVCAANVDPDLVKKAAKKAAKIATHALANGPDQDMDSDGMGVTVGPDDGTSPATTYDIDSDDETYHQEEPVAQTWTVEVNGKPMDADEAKAIVAAAIAERTPPTPAPVAAPTPAAAVDEKEVAVSDSTTKVAEQAAPITLADLAALVSKTVNEAIDARDAKAAKKAARKAARKAQETTVAVPATPAVETATAPVVTPVVAGAPASTVPVVAETTPAGITEAELKQKLAEERAATIVAVREQLIAEGAVPGRKGYRHVNETDEGVDRLTGDDLWNKRSDVWSQLFPQNMSPTPAIDATPVPAGAAA